VKHEGASSAVINRELTSHAESTEETRFAEMSGECPTPSARAEPRPTKVCSLPLAERAELLALARRIRAALPAGTSAARELVVELERRLEVAMADEGAASG
jgi:hypothetical protein